MSREDILADYPDLRDLDIELAHALATLATARDANGESLENTDGVDGSRFRRPRRGSSHLKISSRGRGEAAHGAYPVGLTSSWHRAWLWRTGLVERMRSRGRFVRLALLREGVNAEDPVLLPRTPINWFTESIDHNELKGDGATTTATSTAGTTGQYCGDGVVQPPEDCDSGLYSGDPMCDGATCTKK